MNDRGHSSGEVLLAFLVGGLVGAGIALLTAPQSGRETREMIRDKAGEAKDKIREKAGEASEKIRAFADDTKGKLHDTFEHGREAIEQKKNMVSSAIDAGKKAMKEEKERLSAEG